MIPRRLHKETISSMLGISCGLGASFSSVAEEAASSVAADDKTRLPREEEPVPQVAAPLRPDRAGE